MDTHQDRAKRTERRGRPFIGRTAQVWGRVKPERREEIDALAEERDVPKAALVAALLEVGFQHLDELVLPVRSASAQEELPITG